MTRLVLHGLLLATTLSFGPARAQEDSSGPRVVIEKPYVRPEPAWEGDLIAFVGRRVSVKESGVNDWYEIFTAKYEVLDVIYGDYADKQIEFEVADHYGYPKFASYETVLLYVVRQEGEYYHELYLFDDVYPTADGRWAGCGDPYRGKDEEDRGDVKAHVMRYKAVKLPRKVVTSEEFRDLNRSADFSRRGGMYTCKAGAFAEELFEIRRTRVLAARGFRG